MKPFLRFTCFAVFAIYISAVTSRAQWKEEKFWLKPGWNAIYLHVDASHTTLDQLIPPGDNSTAIDKIWLWKPSLSPDRFMVEPSVPSDPNIDWLGWERPAAAGEASGSEATGSRLTSLIPNQAYLVHYYGNTTNEWPVEGKPVPPQYNWWSKGENFLGFSVPERQLYTSTSDLRKSFSIFLSPVPSLKNADFFRYNGNTEPDPDPFKSALNSVKVTRGEAYWIRWPDQFSRYFGAFEVSLQNSSGIHFGETLANYSVRLKNNTDSSITVTLEMDRSLVAPASQRAIFQDSTGGPAIPPLLIRGELISSNLTYAFNPLESAQTYTLGPRDSATAAAQIVFGLDRTKMTTTAGAFYAGILRLTDSLGYSQIDLPVTAEVPGKAGLWIGNASVTHVQHYLRAYSRDLVKKQGLAAELRLNDGASDIVPDSAPSEIRHPGMLVNGPSVSRLPVPWATSMDFSLNDSLKSFADKFKAPTAALAVYLKSRLSTGTADSLAARDLGADLPASLQQAFVADLNSIIAGPSIYDTARFDGVTLRPETEQLLTQNPQDATLGKLNRLLLEDAYPELPKHPTALSFNASNKQYVGLSDPPILGTKFTIESWVYPESSDNAPRAIVGGLPVAGQYAPSLMLSGGLVQFTYTAQGGIRTVPAAGFPMFTPGDIRDFPGLANKLKKPEPDLLWHYLLGLGAADLAAGDITDWVSLLAKLNDPIPATDKVSLFIRSELTADTKDLVDALPTSGPVSDELKSAILTELSLIISQPLFDHDRFTGVTLRPETAQLNSATLSGDALKRLNRMLLEDVYAEIVKSSAAYRVRNATLAALSAYTGADANSETAKIHLLQDLNSIISDGLSVYTSERFVSVQLRPETQTFISKLGSLTVDERKHLNRLLLEDNYPTEFWRHPKVAPNEWTHLAVTCDAKNIKIVVNGEIAYASPPLSAADLPKNIPVSSIGRVGENYFQGRIAQVRLWNEARPPAEILAKMNIGMITPATGAFGDSPVVTVNDAIGKVARPFPLRLILHHDAENHTRLLQRAFVGPDTSNHAIITVRQGALHQGLLSQARRISAAHLPWSATQPFWQFQSGQFTPGGEIMVTVTESFQNGASNPFLHTFHPDHDNLNAEFNSPLGRGLESYDIRRTITLVFDDVPLDFQSLTTASTRLAGSYAEEITFLAGKNPQSTAVDEERIIHTEGKFVLNRITDLGKLTP